LAGAVITVSHNAFDKRKEMQTEKVHFTKEKETMLVTLYGRALETDAKDPILRDPAAQEAVRRIDYDFQSLNVKWNDILAIAARAKMFDLWVEEFLSNNPHATVLHLGCGLDSRVFRINPSSDVLWFDVDYPEIIDLRQRLFPERTGYQMIGSSVVETDWLNQVPADRPVLVVAEGLMYYLKEEEVKALVKRIVDRFPSGQIMFDAISKLYLKMQKTNVGISATGARMWWGIDNPHELEQWNPRIKLVTNLSVMDQDFPNIKKMSGGVRAVLRILALIPAMKNMGLMLRYRF
jgi:O-methyltransferase involved in polyketide biosynthesis